MSDAPGVKEVDGAHEGPIKTPKQLIIAVLFAFVIPVVVILLLSMFVESQNRPAAGSDNLSDAAVRERTAPIGSVRVQGSAGRGRGQDRRRSVHGAVQRLPRHRRRGRTQVRRRGRLGAAHRAGLRDAALACAARQGQHAAAGRRCVQRLRGGPRGGLHGRQGWRHVPGTCSAGCVVGHGGWRQRVGRCQCPAAGGADPAAIAAAVAQVAAAKAASAPAEGGVVVASAAGPAPALFNNVCTACHSSGAAGAPKLGDKAAWAPRLGQGIDGLTASAIKGKGAMPPRGGSQASDAEIKEVVTYMVGAVK